MIVNIDPKSSVAVFQQLMREIKSSIARGICAPDEAIPSVRQMASQALINPNTVAKAYRELEREGVLYTRQGRGVFVSSEAPEICREDSRRALRERLRKVVDESRRAGIDDSALRQAFDDALMHGDIGGEGRQ